MTLIEVEYPFEVDMALGTSSRVYPSRRAALADAQQMYECQASEDEMYPDNQPIACLPATVREHNVRTINREALCAILNSDGGCWSSFNTWIGSFEFRKGRVRFVSRGCDVRAETSEDN